MTPKSGPELIHNLTLVIQCKPSLPFSVFRLKKPEVGFPLVPNDFSTSEATNRNDHFSNLTEKITITKNNI